MLYSHMQNHSDTIIITQWWTSLKKYTSHFIWKSCVWEGVGDRTELQHIDPHSYGHQRCVFLVLQGCSTGGIGPTLLGADFLYRILSPTAPNTKHSTAWLPVFTELYNRWIAYSISPHDWPSEMCHFRCLWNGMFDCHRAEITVMQFTGLWV